MLAGTILKTSAVQVVALFLGVVSGIFITRLLGPEGRGVYAVFNANSEFLALLFGFGMGSVITYFASNRQIPTDKLLGLSLTALATGSVLVAIVLVVLPRVGLQFPVFPEGYGSSWFRVYLLVTFTLGVASATLSGFLNGWQCFGETNLAKVFTATLFLAATLGLYAGGGAGTVYRNTATVLAISLAVGLGNALLLLRFFLRNVREGIRVSLAGEAEIGIAGRFVYLVYLSELINFFNYRLDIWLVEYFQTSYQVGLYSLAVSASQLLWLIAVPITVVLLPHLNNPDSQSESRRLFLFYSRVTFNLTLIAGVTLFAFADRLTPLIYGAAFRDSIPSLRILIVGAVFSALAKVLSVYVLTRGLIGHNVVAVTAGVVVTLVLDLLLIPRYGIEGASLATTLSYSVILLVLMLVLRRKLDFPQVNYFLLGPEDFALMKERIAYGRQKRL